MSIAGDIGVEPIPRCFRNEDNRSNPYNNYLAEKSNKSVFLSPDILFQRTAEKEGLEPPGRCRPLVFKTSALRQFCHFSKKKPPKYDFLGGFFVITNQPIKSYMTPFVWISPRRAKNNIGGQVRMPYITKLFHDTKVNIIF